ncbi:MAG: dTMP kinase [Clostridia bacterium]|nr:dTMP kinase [Clostridia bacterium]
MKRGLFITVEGTDGCGKTTQIKLMEQYLRSRGHDVLLTREPGGTSIAEKIRDLVLDPANSEMEDITEMMLYAASRAQHIREKIKPSVESGRHVICDRFVDSSYVYQSFGRGIDLKIVESVNRIAVDGMMPDITFFFDLSPEYALKRRIASTGADRIEKEKMDFHMKVYEGYRVLASMYPERIRTIDSSREIDIIFEEVRGILDGLLAGIGEVFV